MRLRAIIAAFLIFPASLAAGQVDAPSEGRPGEPVVITVRSENPVSVVLERGRDQTITRADSFRLSMTPQVAVQCVIIGLDTTLEPAVYELVIRSGANVIRRVFTVRPREFRRQEIALSRTLTELRSGEDPRKLSEARELQQLLAEFNPGAVYQTGSFVWPFPLTRRTSLFGDRRTYLYAGGERASIIHSGLDLASPTGTAVAASGEGRVRMARYRIVTGNTVVVEHLPGVFSLYYHLDTLSVQAGQRVATGDLIGSVGATGLATGPHLHWEFRIGGVAVDPEVVLPGLLVDFDP